MQPVTSNLLDPRVGRPGRQLQLQLSVFDIQLPLPLPLTLERLEERIRLAYPGCRTRRYVDTGPVLERELAEFLQREKVLLCSSGYLANLAVSTSLSGKGDVIIQDRLCHASLIDAARLSGARLLRYTHADMQSLQRQLAIDNKGNTLVVSDGVFSMDGDVPQLKEMAGLCVGRGAWLAIDDAHGIGVTGPGGRGSVAA